MFNDQSSPNLNNVIFSYNYASFDGGGIFNTNSKPIIRDSRFYQNTAEYGGGMANELNSNAQLEDVLFEENSAEGGGGIANEQSNPTIHRVNFIRNIARNHDGGGMFNLESSPIIDTASFIENQAAYGGGLATSGGKPIVRNAQFINNSVNSRGGGAFHYGHTTEARFENVVFAGNSAELSGGGIANQSFSHTTVKNSILSGNYASAGGGISNDQSHTTLINVTLAANTTGPLMGSGYNLGGAIYNEGSSELVVTNSIIWGNQSNIYNLDSTTSFSYSLIEGCKPNGVWDSTCGTEQSGTNLNDSDPLFTSPISYTAAPTTTADLRLQLGSPAINAGNNSYNTTTSDLAGNPRISGTAIDLGAYEYVFAQPLAHAGSNQNVEAGSLVTLDGSASSDPGGHTPLNYQWSQTAGPTVNLSDTTSAQPTFTAPTQATTLTFALVVSNNYGVQSQTAQVSITVHEPTTPTQPHYQQHLPLTQKP